MQVRLNDGSILIAGYLGKDAEYKNVGQNNSSLTKFSVNVGKKVGAQQPTWVNCECWHETARAAASLKKFDVVMCFGHIKSETYTDRDGQQKTANVLEVEGFFLQPKAQKTVDPMIEQMLNTLDDPNSGTPF
jgi:single-stranded DNA-binding protein